MRVSSTKGDNGRNADSALMTLTHFDVLVLKNDHILVDQRIRGDPAGVVWDVLYVLWGCAMNLLPRLDGQLMSISRIKMNVSITEMTCID